MATQTVQIHGTSIGPQSWKNNSLKCIRLSQNIAGKSDRSCEIGRSHDPLPHLRDTVAELSNDEAHKHFRSVRAVVCLLRESLLETNEEIKSLTRGKEAIEKALDNIRKDLHLNKETQDIRATRPVREKEHDGADDLLGAERMHLLNLKKSLESQLQLVQQQLQVLDKARKRLSNVVQERSRILDLVCHALPSVSNSANAVMSSRRESFMGNGCGRMSCSALEPGSGGGFTVDPLGAYTPEANQALQEARDARQRSATLRKNLKDFMDKAAKTQQAAHKAVNSGITQKIAETVSLKQNLHVAAGENRHALHRAQRWYDATEKAWGYSRGPVASSDLSTREKLNRPVISVFQRHPGTNLPEAQEIVKGGDGLLQSLTATSHNIGLLKLARLRLKDDLRDKSAAINVDGSIVRLRRRKVNHRWVMGEAF